MEYGDWGTRGEYFAEHETLYHAILVSQNILILRTPSPRPKVIFKKVLKNSTHYYTIIMCAVIFADLTSYRHEENLKFKARQKKITKYATRDVNNSVQFINQE